MHLPNKNKQITILVILVVLIISGIFHGINMFSFPYYENDEGVYLSQAWSFLYQGKMAPYTYWYDHSPVGWLFTSLWILLSGGIFKFGFSINSGRVFMLLLHLASTYFVFRIGQRLTKSRLTGAIAAIIFSISPLGIFFQRRLLLDNIMTFWFLLSYYLILGNKTKRRLIHFILSAIAFGISVLTKENAIFFIPGFLFALVFNTHEHHKRFVIVKWLAIVGFIVSTYFLYALLKGELFPSGTLLGGHNPHVSLIGTLLYQLSRKGGSPFDLQSSLWHSIFLWTRQDIIIICLGLVCNLALTFIAIFKRKTHYFAVSLFGLFFWYFLARGGIVIEFYVIPLLPILAICIAIYLYELSQTLQLLIKFIPAKLSLLLMFLTIGLSYTYLYFNSFPYKDRFNIFYYLFKSHQTAAQIETVDWIRKNVDTDAIIVIDNYSYLDLHDPNNPSKKVFENAHWYWKIDLDPEIRRLVIQNTPERIDYIAQTPQMRGDLIMGSSPLTLAAVGNSSLIRSFNRDGWGVEIWSTLYPQQVLKKSWDSYRKTFIDSSGRVNDPSRGNITTSEGQSYALLRSVLLDDRPTFDQVWKWTKSNIQQESGIFSWNWKDGKVTDHGTAADADTDTALALLFASKKWSDKSYLLDAQKVINGIWNEEVKSFNNTNYIVPGNWAKSDTDLIINPSYLFPSAYRIFSEVDKSHNWYGLVKSSYEVLNGCTKAALNVDIPKFLPPNWCQLNSNGVYGQSSRPGLESTEYSYDAMRTIWRVSLDSIWYQEPRAKEYLKEVAPFFTNEWQNQKKILVGYDHAGKPWEKYESVLGYATMLPSLMDSYPEIASEIFHSRIQSKFFENNQNNIFYWEDEKNYYTQNWTWFGTALFTHNLPNLWVAP